MPGAWGLSEEVLERFFAERREARYRDNVTPRAMASSLAYLRGLAGGAAGLVAATVNEIAESLVGAVPWAAS